MWVAVGTVAAGAISAGVGAAVSNSAANKAAKSTKYASDKASQVQWDMYDQTRKDFQPFAAPSPRAMATLESALYGGPVGYSDPTTTALTEDQLAEENWKAIQGKDLRSLGLSDDIWKDINNGEDPVGRLSRALRAGDYAGQGVLPYDTSQQWYRGADGKITNVAPQQLTATWKPQESEGFKYTRNNTMERLGRELRMMGRGSGTVAANAMGRTLGDLNANNEATQRNELWNLVKTGAGAAGNVQGAGQNAANNVSGNTINAGNNLAGIQRDNGQTQASLWTGLGGAVANGISAYQMGKYLNGKG